MITDKQKLSDAQWLIRELDQHEGAEGWSQYLKKALLQFYNGEKISRRKR